MDEHSRESEIGSQDATLVEHTQVNGLDKHATEQRSRSCDTATASARDAPASTEKKCSGNEHANKADEPPVESPHKANLVATEEYSVFTVPQKRAIVLAGSYLSWFSPMTGAIYYPALDQVRSCKLLGYNYKLTTDRSRQTWMSAVPRSISQSQRIL